MYLLYSLLRKVGSSLWHMQPDKTSFDDACAQCLGVVHARHYLLAAYGAGQLALYERSGPMLFHVLHI